MAPVAGRIADRKENRLVLAPGLFKGLRTPRVPVHWIAGVLQQVRALFVGQAVGVHAVGAVFMVHRTSETVKKSVGRRKRLPHSGTDAFVCQRGAGSGVKGI